jgi:hypothetical protein
VVAVNSQGTDRQSAGAKRRLGRLGVDRSA